MEQPQVSLDKLQKEAYEGLFAAQSVIKLLGDQLNLLNSDCHKMKKELEDIKSKVK